MDKPDRSIIWVLITLVILSSLSAVWFFSTRERLYDEYVNLEALFKNNVDSLNKKIASSNQENSELKSRIKAIEKEFNVLQFKEKDLRSQRDDLLNEKDQLAKKLAQLNDTRASLEEKIQRVESRGYVASILKEKAGLEVELKRLEAFAYPGQEELAALKQDYSDLKDKYASVESEKEQLEERLKDSEEVAVKLSMDLMQEKDKYRAREARFDDAKRESEFLRLKVSELEELSGKFSNLLKEKNNMQAKIDNLEKDLEYKTGELNKMRVALREVKDGARSYRAESYHSPKEVELPPIVVQNSASGSRGKVSPVNASGRVVTVNQEHNFVVIDVGLNDNVKVGDDFSVYRKGERIGYVKVIQARERIAAADIKNTEDGFEIETDDMIAPRNINY